MPTPWSKKESEDRGNNFVEEYKKLCVRFEYELMAIPQLVPSGQKGFNMSAVMMPVDKRNQGIPSPLSDEVLK